MSLAQEVTHVDRFDYLIIFIGLIVGLAVSKLVHFFSEIMLRRDRAWPTWPHVLWLITLLLSLVYYWWTLWYAIGVLPALSLLGYLLILTMPLLAFLMVSLLCPDEPQTAGGSLETHFNTHARTIYSVVLVYLFVGLAQAIWTWESGALAIWLRLAGAGIMIPPLIARRLWLDRIVAGAALSLLVLYIALVPVTKSPG